jgi:chromosomal replication initiation ATPase DnaA
MTSPTATDMPQESTESPNGAVLFENKEDIAERDAEAIKNNFEAQLLSEKFADQRAKLLAMAEELPETPPNSITADHEKKPIETVLTELEKAGFPKRHRERLAEGPLTGPARDKAESRKADILSGDCIFLLCGNRGPGKTQMATWWAAVRSFKGKPCGRYVKLVDLIADIKSTWHDGGKKVGTEQDILRKYKTTKFLVIDEVQELSGSTWEDRVLTNILDHRYDEMLATVLIANVPEKDARRVFGPSILDRATETGGVVACDWESYRKRV